MSSNGPGHTSTDADAGKLSGSLFDMMLIEMVPMAQRLAEQVHALNMAGDVGNPDPNRKLDDEQKKDAMFYRLESLGYRVGMGVVESLTLTSPAPPPRPSTDLDLIKFLCKDVWTAVFRKQIDNLKTNHRGTFVLSDNSFGPLRRCSLEAGKMEEARALAAPFLNFPQGVVRGSLKALGLDSEVGAEVAGVGLPSVVFVVRKTQEEGKT